MQKQRYFIKTLFFVLFLTLFFAGCEDKSIVNIYDKSILKTPIKCLKLTIIPENEKLKKALEELYHFDDSCPVHLDLSYKSGIKCNSTQNVQRKSIEGFPGSYLRMEIRKGLSLKYSYYIDLDEDVSQKDVQRAFKRIKKDLDIRE